MPRQRRLWSVVLGGFLMAALALSACGGSSTPGGGGNQPKFGGTVTDGLFEEPDNLIVGQSNETFADMVMNTIWAPLIWEDANGLLQPGLLTELPTVANGGYSADFKTITFKLRPNLTWSDGTPLTAQDVAFTIKLMSNPDYGQKTGFPGNEISNVATPDNSTVVLTLNTVDVTILSSGFTDALNFSPIPQSVYGSMAAKDIAKSQQAFLPQVVSGPFKITERVKGDHITVVKNAKYFRAPKPYLDKIVYKIIPDQNTILTALQSGSIDAAWFLDVNKLDQYKAIPGYHVVLPPVPASFELLVFNLYSSSHHILEDINVRKAIKMTVDPNQIINNILKGTGVKTCDDAPATFAHLTDLTCNQLDPAGAKTLLDSAGWTMGSDGFRHKGGVTLELRYTTTARNARRSATQQIFQQELAAVGIKIDILNFPADTYFGTKLPTGDYDIGEYASSPTAGDPDDHTQWDCDQFPAAGGFNVMHWCDQTATTADKAARTNPDQTFRKQQYAILYSEINTQVPAMFLYAFPDIAAATLKLQNYNPGPAGPQEDVAVWNWWLK